MLQWALAVPVTLLALLAVTFLLLIRWLNTEVERVDRTEKRDAYIRIASLREYVIIEQSMPRIELFRRSNNWEREVFRAGDTVPLASIDLALAVDALYRRVEF